MGKYHAYWRIVYDERSAKYHFEYLSSLAMFLKKQFFQIKGLKERIKVEMSSYITFSDNIGEYQAKEAKFLKILEYFTNLKDRPDLAGFLGASITAKVWAFYSIFDL